MFKHVKKHEIIHYCQVKDILGKIIQSEYLKYFF